MKGHLETKEIIIIALLIVGLAAAALLLSQGGAPKAAPPAPAPNVTPPAAPSEPSQPPPSQPNETQAAAQANETVPDNSTIGELLDAAILRLDKAYYKLPHPPSGELKVNTTRWSLTRFNQTPDSVPLKANDIRVSYIRFDDRYIDGLRGFEIKTYETVGVLPIRVFASSVFLGSSSPLEDHLNDSLLSIRYDPYPTGSQTLENCTIIGNSSVQTVSGNRLLLYDFSCKVMFGANP